jgi:pyridoxal phosphate enzyme (YggS family)
MDEHTLCTNIAKLLQRVRLGAEKSQRPDRDILLLAVSKTRPPEDIRAAFGQGLSHFGESYLQEALVKIEALADLPLTWHFIGPIQSNKTRAIASHFHWVHSVDRARIARRLSDQRPDGLPPLQVCLQVNVSGEESKSGASLAALPELAQLVDELPRLQLRGLMTIPRRTEDEGEQRRSFAALRTALEQLQAAHPGLDTLSMGMSDDLESAAAEGATIVRVGTALFGPRNTAPANG